MTNPFPSRVNLLEEKNGKRRDIISIIVCLERYHLSCLLRCDSKMNNCPEALEQTLLGVIKALNALPSDQEERTPVPPGDYLHISRLATLNC